MRSPDPSLVSTLAVLLQYRHEGKERAVAAWELMLELRAAGTDVRHSRRVGEAIAALVEQGHPIVSLSGVGHYWSTDDADLEAAYREARRRALATLRRCSQIKRQIRRGQRSLAL
jgi:hypothetical protein